MLRDRRLKMSLKLPGEITVLGVGKTGLVYNGQQQELLATYPVGTASIHYILDNNDIGNTTPKARTAGTHTIQYYAEETGVYEKSETYSLTVTIEMAVALILTHPLVLNPIVDGQKHWLFRTNATASPTSVTYRIISGPESARTISPNDSSSWPSTEGKYIIGYKADSTIGYDASLEYTVTAWIRPVYVELANGYKIATSNVGALSETDIGDYFSWGNDYNSIYNGLTSFNDSNFNSSYVFSSSNYQGTQGYNITDTEIPLSEDVAYNGGFYLEHFDSSGYGFRTPSSAELFISFAYLMSSSIEKVSGSIGGVNGLIIRDTNNHDNYVFFPNNGYKNNSSTPTSSSTPQIWTCDNSTSSDATAFDFIQPLNLPKYYGLPVRGTTFTYDLFYD